MTTKYTILGWATLGPSCTIELDDDESIDDITYDEKMEYLREELRRRGFTDNQIGQMHIEEDYTEKKFEGKDTEE